MKYFTLVLVIIFSPDSFGGDYLSILSGMKTRIVKEQSWDILYEAEHKEVATYYKANECALAEELKNEFPKGGRAGTYLDYYSLSEIKSGYVVSAMIDNLAAKSPVKIVYKQALGTGLPVGIE